MIWTRARDERLATMIRSGASFDRIAAVLKLTRNAVHTRAKHLGLHPGSQDRPKPSLPRVKWLERPDP